MTINLPHCCRFCVCHGKSSAHELHMVLYLSDFPSCANVFLLLFATSLCLKWLKMNLIIRFLACFIFEVSVIVLALKQTKTKKQFLPSCSCFDVHSESGRCMLINVLLNTKHALSTNKIWTFFPNYFDSLYKYHCS